MRKTSIIKRQVNSKNEGEFCVCPHAEMVKQRPVISCVLNCDRYDGRDGGFVLCGKHGVNKPFHATQARSQPSLWEVFGEGERNGFVMAYGIPKG